MFLLKADLPTAPNHCTVCIQPKTNSNELVPVSPSAAQSPQYFKFIFLSTSYLGLQILANAILKSLSISISPLPCSWGGAQRSVLPSARAWVLGTRWTLLLAHAGVTLDSTHRQIIRPSPPACCLQFLLWERHRQLI